METMYQKQVRTGILSSRLPVEDMPGPGVIRANRSANPVDTKAETKRIMQPLAPVANPRLKNPAINTEPWTTSYAQSRKQPKSATMKSQYRSRKRQANKRRAENNRRRGA